MKMIILLLMAILFAEETPEQLGSLEEYKNAIIAFTAAQEGMIAYGKQIDESGSAQSRNEKFYYSQKNFLPAAHRINNALTEVEKNYGIENMPAVFNRVIKELVCPEMGSGKRIFFMQPNGETIHTYTCK